MAGGSGVHGHAVRSGGASAGADVNALYERHAKRVRAFCLRRLGDEDEAADAVQDTFLRAWLALRGGAEVRHPPSWLLTIAENVCVSRFRARDARVVTAPLWEAAEPGSSEAAGEVPGLTDAVRALPHRQRVALVRRGLEGCSYDEIAEELGVSRASVAALLHRARQTVVESLRKTGRGLASLVPVPALLRDSLEGAAGTSVAAAGTAAMAMAVAQLTPPPPALHQGPTLHRDALVAGTTTVAPSTRATQRVRARMTAPSTARARSTAHDVRPRRAGTAVLVLDVVLPSASTAPWHLSSPPTASEVSPPEPEATPRGDPTEPSAPADAPPPALDDGPVEPVTPPGQPGPTGDQPRPDDPPPAAAPDDAGRGGAASAPGGHAASDPHAEDAPRRWSLDPQAEPPGLALRTPASEDNIGAPGLPPPANGGGAPDHTGSGPDTDGHGERGEHGRGSPPSGGGEGQSHRRGH